MLDRQFIMMTLYRLINNAAMALNSGTSRGQVNTLHEVAEAHLVASSMGDQELIQLLQELPMNSWVRALNARPKA